MTPRPCDPPLPRYGSPGEPTPLDYLLGKAIVAAHYIENDRVRLEFSDGSVLDVVETMVAGSVEPRFYPKG